MATFSRTTLRSASATAAAVMAAGVASLALANVSSGGSHASSRDVRTAETSGIPAFDRLLVAPPPKSWKSATIASGGATLAYPADWRPIPGDSGTVTVALRDRRGLYHGYLNVTPKQGAEQLTGWPAFRTRRNTEEGDRQTRIVAAVEGLRFARSHGSCVIDDYLSPVGSHAYRELACIVAGSHYTNVFVGATLLADWPRLGPAIERSASALIER
jgi:hypothetical protein